MNSSKLAPRPQDYKCLLALRLLLADGTSLDYEAGQLLTLVGDPGCVARALQQILNSAYALKGYGPAYPGHASKVALGLVECVIEMHDRRASSPDRRTVIHLVPTSDGGSVQSLQATSEPGAIYLYVYDTDVGEIVREVSSDLLPLLRQGTPDDG